MIGLYSLYGVGVVTCFAAVRWGVLPLMCWGLEQWIDYDRRKSERNK